LAVLERMIAEYEHGVWLVDLSSIAHARLMPSAICTALGLEISAGDQVRGLNAALRDRRMLLLLDSCERVIDAAADLVAAILGRSTGVTILAASREPLTVVCEQTHRLRPLRSPEPSSQVTAAEAAAYPAVQLF